MKKRRLTLVAFLLISALVIGVGYATVTGTLKITGNATYKGPDVVNPQVNAAMKFDSIGDTKNAVANITNADTSADMTVTFNDTAGDAKGGTLEAYADYVIKYDSTDTTLPQLKVTPDAKFASEVTGFTIECTLVEGEEILSAGDTATYRVTVKYALAADATIPTATQSATIDVSLNYTSDLT